MSINQYIDHTLLKPDATSEQIAKICQEAKHNEFAAVCVNSFYVPFASKLLKGTAVKICSVVGFPLGASPKEVKALEAKMAIDNGANEIDMVLNIGALKDGLDSIVKEDIHHLAETCHQHGAILKVIFETCLLTDDQIITACHLSVSAGADFIKTSTGFSTGGATLEVVTLMKKTVGDSIKIKASGGVKSPQDAAAIIKAGANRIGTSSGVKLVQGEKSNSNY